MRGKVPLYMCNVYRDETFQRFYLCNVSRDETFKRVYVLNVYAMFQGFIYVTFTGSQRFNVFIYVTFTGSQRFNVFMDSGDWRGIKIFNCAKLKSLVEE